MKTLKPLITELIKLVKDGTNLAKQELPVVAKEIEFSGKRRLARYLYKLSSDYHKTHKGCSWGLYA